jgi:hypothetical protein
VTFASTDFQTGPRSTWCPEEGKNVFGKAGTVLRAVSGTVCRRSAMPANVGGLAWQAWHFRRISWFSKSQLVLGAS